MFRRVRNLVNPIRQAWLTYGHYLTNAIAPPVCLLCGAAGQGQARGRGHQYGHTAGEPWGLDLCSHCETACPLAGPDQQAPPVGIDHLRALLLYRPPADELVQRLKFHHQQVPARVLGMLMARAWRGGELPQALVPMPLHPQRLRERGFNQATEIGRHLVRRLGLPLLPDLLQRQRDTAAQSGLTAAERTRNIAGAFRCRPDKAPPSHVALLDDVLTTGATAAAAADALRHAGCKQVDLWVCARTPARPREPRDGIC